MTKTLSNFLQGNITKWLKKGDKILPGEVLCEVPTPTFLGQKVLLFLLLKSFAKWKL
jgi:hypothetical protein